MALIYPSKIGACSKEKAQVYRVLKKLSDEFKIWFSTPTNSKLAKEDPNALPDCMILYKERFGFIVHISNTDQKAINQIIQKEIFDTEKSITLDQLGHKESTILETFCVNLRLQISGDTPLKKLVVFPAVKQHSIEALRLKKTVDGANFLGIDKIKDHDLTNYLTNLAEQQLPEPHLLQLRRSFTPETEVPSSFSPLSPLAPRENKAPESIHHKLLDLDQEWCMKNDLYLSEEASKEVTTSETTAKNKNQLITGMAGCGKSLILLYRALYNAQLSPEAKILVLTHNRPLISELERRAGEIGDSSRNLKYSTFFQWALSELYKTFKPNSPRLDIISPFETKVILAKQLHKDASSTTTKLSADFLAEEIGWIKDHNIKKSQDYLNIQRNGRGGALQINQRKEVWKHFVQYQNKLHQGKQIDWQGVAIRFHDAVMSGEIHFPQYDCILIDEAQFFAKSWFDIVNKAVTTDGQIFLAADPTQGFLKRKQSWIASGIDVRGRTKKLKKPYRNSSAILSFATQFFRQRSVYEDKETNRDLNIPSQKQIEEINTVGTDPEIIRCNSEQECLSYVCNEVKKLHQKGIEPNNILILHTTKQEQVYASLKSSLGSDHLIHDAQTPPTSLPPFVKICKLYAATGLESSIIFLLGIDSILDKEGDPTLNEDALTEMKRDHTRLLYMAFTRAGQKLVIMTTNKQTEEYLHSLSRVKQIINK